MAEASHGIHVQVVRRWWRDNARDTFINRDAAISLVAVVAVGVIAGHYGRIRTGGAGDLLVTAGFGFAILAVVLTALSILISLVGDAYLRVLELTGATEGRSGVKDALTPYVTVSFISALQVLVGLIGRFLFDLLPWWGQTSFLAADVGLLVWATLGTFMLTVYVAEHGLNRADILEGIEKARQEIRDIREKQVEVESKTHLNNEDSERQDEQRTGDG